MGLIRDVALALTQALDRRFLSVLLRGILIALGLLVAVSVLVVWAVTALPDQVGVPVVGEVSIPEIGVQGLALAAMLALSAILMFPVAAVFVGFFLDEVAGAVEARHYPDLPPARKIGLVQGLVQAVKFMGLVIAVNLAALVVYLVMLASVAGAPLAPLTFYLVNGYLLGREYFQVVAERRLDERDVTALRKRNEVEITLAGVLMALPLSIPIVNLTVPVLGVAVSTHLFHRLRGHPRRRGRLPV